MHRIVFQLVKLLLTRVGACTSPTSLHRLQLVVNYMKLGRWMAANQFRIGRRVRDRTAVFRAVSDQVRNRRVLYLEFGVYKGACMRYWSAALRHPESILHGFDSFEGLPEAFDQAGRYGKGAFDVGGQIPRIDDPRVTFFKGWFDEVLPTYRVPEHDVLVVVLDADLYASTQLVLRFLRPYITPGTFVYFDEMSRPDHEPRAFEEFIRQSGLRFRLVSADLSLNNAFFECVP